MISEAALSDWRILHPIVSAATEEECIDLLRREKLGKRRRVIMLRIHSRFNLLRAHREREEIRGIANAQ